MKVELGSVVYLKSGGPLMTVEELGEHADARCAWFVDLAVQREWFALQHCSLRIRRKPASPLLQRKL